VRTTFIALVALIALAPSKYVSAQTGAGPTREGKELKLPVPSKLTNSSAQTCTEVTHPCGVNNSQSCTIKRCD
jgi:hypothetical protein